MVMHAFFLELTLRIMKNVNISELWVSLGDQSNTLMTWKQLFLNFNSGIHLKSVVIFYTLLLIKPVTLWNVTNLNVFSLQLTQKF